MLIRFIPPAFRLRIDLRERQTIAEHTSIRTEVQVAHPNLRNANSSYLAGKAPIEKNQMWQPRFLDKPETEVEPTP
jgi:hypothetical protein